MMREQPCWSGCFFQPGFGLFWPVVSVFEMAGVPGAGEDTGECIYGSLDRRWSHLRRAQVGEHCTPRYLYWYILKFFFRKGDNAGRTGTLVGIFWWAVLFFWGHMNLKGVWLWHEIVNFSFFHESVSRLPLSTLLGLYRICTKIRGDIRCFVDIGDKLFTSVNDTSDILSPLLYSQNYFFRLCGAANTNCGSGSSSGPGSV